MTRELSTATLRAFDYPNKDGEWFCGFAYTPVTGLGLEVGAHRRDPSSVIQAGDRYYVYYTKSVGPYFGRRQQGNPDHKIFPWDKADIFCASSADGINWTELGKAVPRGPKGSFDDRTVCTPDVLAHDGKYYLVYQTQTYTTNYTGASENVGMSVADSPEGPWQKVASTIIEPMEGGIWFDEENNYNSGYFSGVTHDPMLLHYQGAFWLYYKCASRRPAGTSGPPKMKYAGPDTRWGVAVSQEPTGPYSHSEHNPVTNSGHETLLWRYNGGIAALLNRDGPEKDTIQWSPDGINFEIMAHVEATPQAGGPFRCPDTDDYPLKGLQWGLCHLDERGSAWNHIVRYDVDTRLTYLHSHSYPAGRISDI